MGDAVTHIDGADIEDLVGFTFDEEEDGAGPVGATEIDGRAPRTGRAGFWHGLACDAPPAGAVVAPDLILAGVGFDGDPDIACGDGATEAAATGEAGGAPASTVARWDELMHTTGDPGEGATAIAEHDAVIIFFGDDALLKEGFEIAGPFLAGYLCGLGATGGPAGVVDHDITDAAAEGKERLFGNEHEFATDGSHGGDIV